MVKKLLIKPNNIYHVDCRVGMKYISDGKIDLVITDPPFAIDFKAKKANYNRKSENVMEGYVEIPKKDYDEFTYSWLKEIYRILSDDGSMFICSGYTNLITILNNVEKTNFELINLIPWKYQFGVYTRRRFVASHYEIIFCCKRGSDKKRQFYPESRFDTKKEQYADMQDVWEIKREYWTGKIKPPTKLPSELIRKMLSYTSEKNDLIFDPFLGSGQVALVAKEMNRRYLGFEKVKQYFDFASSKLK